MSFFKNRSGGSLFRFRALTGYIKHLFYGDREESTGELLNKMSAKYRVEKDE